MDKSQYATVRWLRFQRGARKSADVTTDHKNQLKCSERLIYNFMNGATDDSEEVLNIWKDHIKYYGI